MQQNLRRISDQQPESLCITGGSHATVMASRNLNPLLALLTLPEVFKLLSTQETTPIIISIKQETTPFIISIKQETTPITTSISHLQYLIAYSMQIWRGKAWEFWSREVMSGRQKEDTREAVPDEESQSSFLYYRSEGWRPER